jgi:hypothetical protein
MRINIGLDQDKPAQPERYQGSSKLVDIWYRELWDVRSNEHRVGPSERSSSYVTPLSMIAVNSISSMAVAAPLRSAALCAEYTKRNQNTTNLSQHQCKHWACARIS